MKHIASLWPIAIVPLGLIACSSLLAAQIKAKPKDDRPFLAVSKVSKLITIPAIAALTGPADATLIVKKSSQGYYFDSVVSAAGAYGSAQHPYYVVDIVVPASFKFDNPDWCKSIRIYAQEKAWNSYTSATCRLANATWFVQETRTVVATGQKNSKLVASQTKKGDWIPFVDMGISPYCDLGLTYRVAPVPVGPLVSKTFRVMVKAKRLNVIRRVTVGWQWDF